MRPKETPLEVYRKEAFWAAKDLGYSDEILDKIKSAKTEIEISRIMRGGRDELDKRSIKRKVKYYNHVIYV